MNGCHQIQTQNFSCNIVSILKLLFEILKIIMIFKVHWHIESSALSESQISKIFLKILIFMSFHLFTHYFTFYFMNCCLLIWDFQFHFILKFKKINTHIYFISLFISKFCVNRIISFLNLIQVFFKKNYNNFFFSVFCVLCVDIFSVNISLDFLIFFYFLVCWFICDIIVEIVNKEGNKNVCGIKCLRYFFFTDSWYRFD